MHTRHGIPRNPGNLRIGTSWFGDASLNMGLAALFGSLGPCVLMIMSGFSTMDSLGPSEIATCPKATISSNTTMIQSTKPSLLGLGYVIITSLSFPGHPRAPI